MWLLRVCSLLFLVVSCNAECYIYKPRVDLLSVESILDNMKGCIDPEGQTHDFNSEWEHDCYNCVCAHSGIRCCNKIPSAIDHPDECEMLVDKTTCSVNLVLVSDHSKPCVLA
ncbi:beta-microseminoprotein [Danio rerio]|uniref:Beta-microseminoprotein n=1 Tax=Danio rerio TaxID=7955 RepID=A0A8M1RME2_DANRE|nr:beta-microseminoprotein-like isoform X2 [Danio rerio]|eukprot:XP_002665222.2 beta-microseminoprotein-like isoform X2 [Danio rerio]